MVVVREVRFVGEVGRRWRAVWYKILYFAGSNHGFVFDYVGDRVEAIIQGGSGAATYRSANGTGWVTINGRTGSGANQWNCIEAHVKANTGTSTNGVIEFWVNGTRIINVTNARFDSSGAFDGFGDPIWPSNQSNPNNAPWAVYQDDLFVSDVQRIGCPSGERAALMRFLENAGAAPFPLPDGMRGVLRHVEVILMPRMHALIALRFQQGLDRLLPDVGLSLDRNSAEPMAVEGERAEGIELAAFDVDAQIVDERRGVRGTEDLLQRFGVERDWRLLGRVGLPSVQGVLDATNRASLPKRDGHAAAAANNRRDHPTGAVLHVLRERVDADARPAAILGGLAVRGPGAVPRADVRKKPLRTPGKTVSSTQRSCPTCE